MTVHRIAFRIPPLRLAGAAVLLVAASAAVAQGYPSRPIRVIVGYPPGGPVDTAARFITPGLAQRLGQPVVIENRGGASGTVAGGVVARAEPDGYTLFFAASATQTIAPHVQKGMPYDPLVDYTPIANAVNAPNVLVVGRHVPARTVGQLVTFAKANPDKATYGSAGLGASNHLAGELMKKVTGAPLVHVPYKGNAPAMADVLGGQLSFMFDAIGTGRAAVAGDRAVALAVTASTRHPLLPDVPTMAELGFPELVVTSFYAFEGPPKLPAAIVERLNAAIRAVLAEPEVARRLVEAGNEVAPSSPEALGRRVKEDHARWGALVRELKLD
jgi:tripartite-type tricarboxylate transporter receptor subunit TctC